MSRKYYKCCDPCNYGYGRTGYCGYGGFLNNCGSGCCNFSSFVILILILLTFGKKSDCSPQGTGGIDKGLLFIIALYYLSCCNPCYRNYH